MAFRKPYSLTKLPGRNLMKKISGIFSESHTKTERKAICMSKAYSNSEAEGFAERFRAPPPKPL